MSELESSERSRSTKKHKKEKKAHKEKKHKRKRTEYDEPTLNKDFSNDKVNEMAAECNTSFEAFGPALPPHLLVKQPSEDAKVIGPILPAGISLETKSEVQDEEVNDDVHGPIPLNEGLYKSMTTAQIELEQRALEIKLSKLDPATNKIDTNVREEWMLELPEVGLKTGLASLKRTFHTKERPDFSDRSSWTKTPNSVDQPTTSKVTESSKSKAEEQFQAKRDAEQEKMAKKLKKKQKRDESLYDIHQKKLKKEKNEKKSNGKPERRPFSREVDLQMNKIDKHQTKSIVDKAKFLDSRFSSGNTKKMSSFKNCLNIIAFSDELNTNNTDYSPLGPDDLISMHKSEFTKPETISSSKSNKISLLPDSSTSRKANYPSHQLGKKFIKNNKPKSNIPCVRSNSNEENIKIISFSKNRFTTQNILTQNNFKKLIKTPNDFPTPECSSSSICEVMDIHNPFNLDYQGIDYKNTYALDEQICQNQVEYRKIRRYQQRRNVKRNTATAIDKKQQNERISIPKHFSVPSSTEIVKSQIELSTPLENGYGKLVRSEDKQEVKLKIKNEEVNRRNRYEQMYIQEMKRNDKKNEEEQELEKLTRQNVGLLLIKKDFEDFVNENSKYIKGDIKKRGGTFSDSEILNKWKTDQESSVEIEKQKQFHTNQKGKRLHSKCSANGGSERTNDDDDGFILGKQMSKFFLRGYLDKEGSNIRGKKKENVDDFIDIGSTGCKFRKKTVVNNFRDNILNKESLFNRPKTVKQTPLRLLRRKIEQDVNKNICVENAKVKVRKFNLIGYMYGINKTKSYQANNFETKNVKKHGITLQRSLSTSNSFESEWVPDDSVQKQSPKENFTLRERGNMPAPLYRETTLRANPKRPRDYKKLRIPSLIFDEFVQNKNVPVMKKLDEDKKIKKNIKLVKKSEYGKLFEYRHHHDHSNPTQHKIINVHFTRKIPSPNNFQVKSKLPEKHDKNVIAKPNTSDFLENNFTIPKLDIDQLIKDYSKNKGTFSKEILKHRQIPQSNDVIFHTLDSNELIQFPGRELFLDFLAEIKTKLVNRAGIIDSHNVSTADELKNDLSSVESCFSSLSSSDCTNLSNDSGSFLIAGNKKIPLDYIRKPYVPFQKNFRYYIEAYPNLTNKTNSNPYKILPFSGQQNEQIMMTAPTDNFFTFNTRLQNDLRNRLKIKSNDSQNKLIGTKKGAKMRQKTAIDIDKLYIEDLSLQTNLRPYKFKSSQNIIKDALRKYFVSMLIQGEIVRMKIYDKQNETYFQGMVKLKTDFEKLFDKWEKKEYDDAMNVVNRVKPYFEATDKFRCEAQKLSKEYTALNMEIVYKENDWIHRIILQNFHYLLADMEWRLEHDWIHMKDNGELEGYDESIRKRNITNIRKRNKDDAWEIKDYYEKVYLHNNHQIICVFQNAKEFVKSIENLKAKSFVMLLELHYTLWILAEVKQNFQELKDWCIIDLELKKQSAEKKCTNKYFMEERSEKLQVQVNELMGDPIESTFNYKRLSQIKGICNEVYKDLVPIWSQVEVHAIDQISKISDMLKELFDKFEDIPVEMRQRVENNYRKRLSYRLRMSRQAVLNERRIAAEKEKVQRNLAPPFQKSKLKKQFTRFEKKEVERKAYTKTKLVSEKDQFLYKIFADSDSQEMRELRESLGVVDDIQQSIVPFYFDHFLSINGYQPNYDFLTQIELRDGPEIERLKNKHLIPEVIDKLEKWQINKKIIMEENISKNPQIYQSVQI